MTSHVPISSCMVILDHSQSMLKDDYAPSRFEFQQQASGYMVDCILEEALTASGGHGHMPKIGVMVGTDVLIGPQEDTDIVYEALVDNLALASTDLTTSLRVASLALRKYAKETQEKGGRKVIIAFIGSPLNEEDDNLEHIGRILKRNSTEIIIVAMGDEADEKSLQDLVSVAGGKVVKIAPQDVARDALDGLFCSQAPSDRTYVFPQHGPITMPTENENASHRIGALLNRSREERRKIQLMLEASLSSDFIPPILGMNKDTFATSPVFDNTNDNEDDCVIRSPANSENRLSQWEEKEPYDERASPLLQALQCGPEIIPMQPTIATAKPQLTVQVNDSRDQEDTYDLHRRHLELKRRMSMSPTSGGTDLQQEQENIARFANLRQTHVSVAEYERVTTELRAANRYIRVLQRLVSEKDEMISALHDMIGCLRSQTYDLGIGQKSEVTSLTLDGAENKDFFLNRANRVENTSTWKSKNLHGLDDDDGNDLKPLLSSDSQISINEIRKRTRELETLHASLKSKSKALETMSSEKSSTLTDKRNKKRELEALRASVITARY